MSAIWYGVPPPPAPPDPVYDVIVPAPGERHEVTILREGILGMYVHYLDQPGSDKKLARKCTQEEGACPHCPAHALWMGFLPVYHHGTRSRCILRVGQESAGDLAARYATTLQGLRGARVIVWRGDGRRTRKLSYERSPVGPPTPLPSDIRMAPTISRMYGGCTVDEGAVYSPEECEREGGDQ